MLKFTGRLPIVAVDFDGTICEEMTYPGIGKLIPGADTVLKELKDSGAILILWTCRTGKELADAVVFCMEHGILFDAVNQNYPQLPFGTSNKVFADWYLDNRSMEVDWQQFRTMIENTHYDNFTVLK